MTSLKSVALVILVLTLMVFLLYRAAAAQDENAPAKTEKEGSVWMQHKAGLAHGIMTGLTKGDFEKIKQSATLMNVLSYFEGYSRSNHPDYRRQLSQFDAANRELIRMADAKNLEGATLAFNQLTVSCVYCHKRLRDVGEK